MPQPRRSALLNTRFGMSFEKRFLFPFYHPNGKASGREERCQRCHVRRAVPAIKRVPFGFDAALAYHFDKPLRALEIAVSVKGRLRLSAPLLFAQTAMGRLAAEFALKHPAVRLEVTTDDREVDMIEEGYDLVIRVNPAPDQSLVGRAFLRDRLVVVSSPALARPEGGMAVPAVVRTSGERQAWRVKSDAGTVTIAVDPVLGLSSLIMARDAVRAGVGAARLPISLVSRDLANGRLVQWGEVDAPEITLWTLYPTRRLLSARVAAFLDHLREAFPNGTPDELAAYVGR